VDFDVGPELEALREQARAVALAGVARHGRYDDPWINGVSKEFSRELASHGWLGMTWPADAGGGGRPPIERLVVFEQMITAGAPIAASWVADRQMGPSIITYGTPDQRAELLPPILAGDATWCIGMSEPNAGSDLAALTTSARRAGDRWVINGQKIWTSLAARSDWCYLICRTGTGRSPHEGISEIVVPMDSPGIEDAPSRTSSRTATSARCSSPMWRCPSRTSSVWRATRSARPCVNSSTSAEGSIGSCPTASCSIAPSPQPTRPIRSFVRRSPRSRPGTASAGSSSTAKP